MHSKCIKTQKQTYKSEFVGPTVPPIGLIAKVNQSETGVWTTPVFVKVSESSQGIPQPALLPKPT